MRTSKKLPARVVLDNFPSAYRLNLPKPEGDETVEEYFQAHETALYNCDDQFLTATFQELGTHVGMDMADRILRDVISDLQTVLDGVRRYKECRE